MNTSNIKYDKHSRTLTSTYGNITVLSPQCGTLLELLLEETGTIVTRDKMRQVIWGHNVVSEDVINHLVCRLRKELNALEDCAHWKIEAVPKIGYRIVCDEAAHNLKYWLNRWIEWVHHKIK